MEFLQQREVPVVTEDGHVVSRMLYIDECQAILTDLDEDLIVCFRLNHLYVFSQLARLMQARI